MCALSPLSCCVISFSKGCSHPHLSKEPQWDSVLAPSLTHLLFWHHSSRPPRISANVNSEWMGWDAGVNDDALTAVYMELRKGCLNLGATPLEPRAPSQWNGQASISTHTHTQKVEVTAYPLRASNHTVIFTPTGSSRFPNCFRKRSNAMFSSEGMTV